MQNRRLAHRTNRIWPTVALTAALSAQGGCFLIPTADATACTCDMGEVCNAAGVCQPDPEIMPPNSDMMPACIYNSECDSGVCEYDSTNIMANRCLRPSEIAYVDIPGTCGISGNGTRQNPYCLDKAIAAVTSPGSSQVIRLLSAADYGPIDSVSYGFGGKKLILYGPYEPKPGVNPLSEQVTLSGQGGAATAAVSLSSLNTHLVLDGVVISAKSTLNKNAVECRVGTSVTLRRSILRDSDNVTTTTGWGLWGDSCAQVLIERSYIIKNAGALFLKYIDNIEIKNSIFASNNSSGSIYQHSPIHIIRTNQQSSNIKFNTIVDSFGPIGMPGGFSGAISNPTQILEGSILNRNSLSSSQAQYSPIDRFVLQYVLLGAEAQYAPPSPPSYGVRQGEPLFSNVANFDYRLTDDTKSGGTNSQCCLRQIPMDLNAGVDLFGKRRWLMTELGAIGRDVP